MIWTTSWFLRFNFFENWFCRIINNVNYGFDSTNEYLYLIDFQTLVLKPDGLILFSIDKKVCKKSQKV